jgi:hypothetical protein
MCADRLGIAAGNRARQSAAQRGALTQGDGAVGQRAKSPSGLLFGEAAAPPQSDRQIQQSGRTGRGQCGGGMIEGLGARRHAARYCPGGADEPGRGRRRFPVALDHDQSAPEVFPWSSGKRANRMQSRHRYCAAPQRSERRSGAGAGKMERDGGGGLSPNGKAPSQRGNGVVGHREDPDSGSRELFDVIHTDHGAPELAGGRPSAFGATADDRDRARARRAEGAGHRSAGPARPDEHERNGAS